MPKVFLPILLTVGGLGIGYTLYRQLAIPSPPPPALPGPRGPQTAGQNSGVGYKSGSFDVYVPFEGVGNFIKGLFDGGTKDNSTTEPAKFDVELTEFSPLDEAELAVTPRAPASYGIAPTPAYGQYSGLGIGSRRG